MPFSFADLVVGWCCSIHITFDSPIPRFFTFTLSDFLSHSDDESQYVVTNTMCKIESVIIQREKSWDTIVQKL